MRWNRLWTLAAAAIAATFVSGNALAATVWALGNHPDGNRQADGPYGLRVDDSTGVNTFDFESTSQEVLFEITSANAATVLASLATRDC